MKFRLTIDLDDEVTVDGDKVVWINSKFDPDPVPVAFMMHATSFMMGWTARNCPAGYEATLEKLTEMAMSARFQGNKGKS